MKRSGWVILIIIIIIVAGGIYYFTRQSNNPPANNQTNQNPPTNQVAGEEVSLSSKEGVGNFLVDSKGMTLYYFAKDSIDKSNCTGACLTAWPAYYAENLTVKQPLNKSDFEEITRDDGSSQATYKGWPLYYYQNDAKPGDILGQGVANIWYVMTDPFYTVMVQNQTSVGGNYLVDAKGMTLYYYKSDRQGTSTISAMSNCTGACLTEWPPFYAEEIVVPSLMKTGDFSTYKRQDGSEQLLYKGWPLYQHATDKKSGDTTGQGDNNLWFVVKP
jgi:predicted lipoprotein with Yx(FWY)xxD motif